MKDDEITVTETTVSDIDYKPEDAMMVVKESGSITTYIPNPKLVSPFGEPGAHALMIMGLVQHITDNPGFVEKMVEVGRKAYKQPDVARETFLFGLSKDCHWQLSGEQIQDLLKKGIIETCDSPAHRGGFHLSESYTKKYGSFDKAMAALQLESGKPSLN